MNTIEEAVPVAAEGDASHEWVRHEALEICRRCGVVRRRDRQNSTCKGVVRVTLREGAVPVSDPVAEAVGRPELDEAINGLREDFAAVSPDIPRIKELEEQLAKAGERVAELEKEEATLRGELGAIIMIFKAHGFATVKLPLSFAVSQQIDRAEAAEAQLAEAKRLLKGRDDFLVERDLFSEFAAWIAGQPVPDPTLEVTK